MYHDAMTHLPDPERQSEFYDSVTAKRGLAWVVDMIIVAVLTTIIALISIVGVFLFPVIWFLVDFTYRWSTLARGSSTWGMRLMSIEFRDAFGQRLNVSQAFLHTLGYFVSMSMVLVQLVSIVLMGSSSRGQGLTDHVLGTVALNRRA